VHPHRIDIGAVEKGLVRAGIIGPNALDQLILAQKPPRGRFGFAALKGARRRSGRRKKRALNVLDAQ
jgi:hypothetical protein